MELAGKYGVNPGAKYVPDVFPNQAQVQKMAMQISDPALRQAALQLQYPFKLSDLSPVKDPRDYYIPQDGLWRSQLLPKGVTIDQAIKDGIW